MQTRQIERSRWTAMCDALSRIYAGSTGSLEILEPDLGAQYAVEEEPLRGITYDSSGIEIIFAIRQASHYTHRISRPKQLQIEEDDAGLAAAMLIDSEDDPRVILRFHAPVSSKLLPAA
jgi:hypothetical protein